MKDTEHGEDGRASIREEYADYLRNHDLWFLLETIEETRIATSEIVDFIVDNVLPEQDEVFMDYRRK